MNKPTVHIYTDGACSPNPGVGGWGAILISPGHGSKRRELSGAEPDSTNNRMELMAAIKALEALKQPCQVALTTDSQYLRNAFTQGWIKNWIRNGWRTAAKKPVLNQDLWRELIRLTDVHEVSWNWTRGHAADPLNERCDELAVEARENLARRISK
jgi:ribonuclease HI